MARTAHEQIARDAVACFLGAIWVFASATAEVLAP